MVVLFPLSSLLAAGAQLGLFIKTVAVDGAAAVTAAVAAGRADLRARHGVLFEAFIATGIVTAITDADAAVAAFTTTMLANVPFIRVDTPAAISAGASAPFTQRH